MKKYIILLVMLILVSSSVNAIVFNDDSTFSQDDTKYIFHQGVELKTFDFSTNAITINDEQKLIFVPTSGTLTIDFYNISGNNTVIGLSATMPQTIKFQLSIDNDRYYLMSNDEYFLESVPISAKITNFTYVSFLTDDSPVESVMIQKKSWAKRNALIIVIPEINSFFEETLLFVSNLFILLFIAIILIVIISIKYFFKRRNYNV